MIRIFIFQDPNRSNSLVLAEMVKNKCVVLPGPGNFVPGAAARNLQNIVSFISDFSQTFSQGLKIRIPGAKRNRAGSTQTVFDMDASNPLPIGSKFINRGVSEGRAIPGIVINFQARFRQSG